MPAYCCCKNDFHSELNTNSAANDTGKRKVTNKYSDGNKTELVRDMISPSESIKKTVNLVKDLWMKY